MTPFLASVDLGLHQGILLPLVAISLSLMIPIVAIVAEHFQKQARMRLLEKALEHGVDIADLRLEPEASPGPRLPYRSGSVTLAVGVALLAGGLLATERGTFLFTVLVVAAAICICVGIALLINDRLNRDRLQQAPRC